VKRTTPLRGTTPLARSRAKRMRPLRRPAMDRSLRHQVYVRAVGRCEFCGVPLPGDAWDAHHRQLRSRGGPDSLPNLVALCRTHHRWVHEHPAAATAVGFMVPSWADPDTTPLHLHGRRWVLPGERYTLTDAPKGA